MVGGRGALGSSALASSLELCFELCNYFVVDSVTDLSHVATDEHHEQATFQVDPVVVLDGDVEDCFIAHKSGSLLAVGGIPPVVDTHQHLLQTTLRFGVRAPDLHTIPTPKSGVEDRVKARLWDDDFHTLTHCLPP